jgi:lipopolysaccharide export LptBFGC system permease protein LptF
MTAPTPKPDAPKPEENAPPRRFRLPRSAALAASACLAFAVFAVALIRVLPSPHSKADYLIVGTLATLAALITLFAGLVMGRRKR